jgi:hypothetical protein
MFYVQVDDPAAALEKIKSLGASTVSEPVDVPGGPTIAHFADPSSSAAPKPLNLSRGGCFSRSTSHGSARSGIRGAVFCQGVAALGQNWSIALARARGGDHHRCGRA